MLTFAEEKKLSFDDQIMFKSIQSNEESHHIQFYNMSESISKVSNGQGVKSLSNSVHLLENIWPFKVNGHPSLCNRDLSIQMVLHSSRMVFLFYPCIVAMLEKL